MKQGNSMASRCIWIFLALTQMTQHFMAHGKEGAESLAGIINTIFDPIISSIYAHGGFVAGICG